jgi:hypothetical protein
MLAESTPFGLPLGIHRNIPNHVYHQRRLGLVSKGALEAIGRSAKFYRSWLVEPDEDTPALAFGRAFHCALLEPRVFAETYTVEPDFGDCRKTDSTTKEDAKANKIARDAWRAEHEGHEFLSDADSGAIYGMVAAIREHELGALILRDGEPELSLSWKDRETGLFCKTRPDYYVRSQRMCVDVKTTLDAREESFRRDMVKYDYPLQDALYREGFASVGEPVEHFVFLAVEKVVPYDAIVHTLDGNGVSLGYTRSRSRIERMAECTKTNRWPGYEPRINTIELPPWY